MNRRTSLGTLADLAAALISTLSHEATAQSASLARLVLDINTSELAYSASPRSARARPGNRNVRGFLKVGSWYYFVARTPGHRRRAQNSGAAKAARAARRWSKTSAAAPRTRR